MKRLIGIFLAVFLIMSAWKEATASHLAGGTASYRFQKDTTVSGLVFRVYQVTFSVYADCLNGQPSAIAEDNPMFMGVFDGNGNLIANDSTDVLSTGVSVIGYDSSCISVPPSVCVLDRVFEQEVYVLPTTSGNIVADQRCCRSGQLANLFDPGDGGYTYYVRIPPSGLADSNSSPVFNPLAGRLLCLNHPFTLNCSATDINGDSLSYFLAPLSSGATAANVKPYASPPFYDTANYQTGYNSSYPIASDPLVQIDPVTGILSGTPTDLGYYAVNIGCVEWRHHVPLDTVRNEFNLTVCNFNSLVPAVSLLGAGAIKVMPNPSNGFFDVAIPTNGMEQIKVQITDCLGRSVGAFLQAASSIPGTTNIDLDLPVPGVYFLRIVIDQYTFVCKLQKV